MSTTPIIDAVFDVSHHQHKPEFKRAKLDNQIGVVHKATQGVNYVDPTFLTRKGFIRDSGLLLGAYHFLTDSDPIQQAEHFLTIAHDVPLLVVDWETSNGKLPPIDTLSAFVYFIQHEGRHPGLYIGQYDLKTHVLKFDASIKNCWLWVARYGKAPEVPPLWSTWTMWQWTDGLHGNPRPISGIGYCDRDRFHGAEEDLRKLWSGT